MKNHVLDTLRYFEIFSHPLRKEELYAFLAVRINPADFDALIVQMLAEGTLKEYAGYLQQSKTENLSALRIEKEERAKQLIQHSRFYSGIIARFPFVKSVAISGSVSKLSAGEDADLDFFIITAANRLWISRTLLHLFKKLTFVTGHQHFFCMNYFVAEDHLALPFKNIYTAIELKTLIPVYGAETIDALQKTNAWTNNLLPNHNGEPLFRASLVAPRFVFKPINEWLISRLMPVKINEWLMKFTDWKWKRKFAHLNLSQADYDRAMMTKPYLSKNHPHDYQKKVMSSVKKQPIATKPINAFS